MTPDRRAEIVSLAVAVAIGALAFHYCVGFVVVPPADTDWIYMGGVDPSAHFTGWHMFRSSPWEVPPGSVRALGYPVGTSVGFTDSIPLLAIALKPFHEFLPRTFQYLGMWLLACFLLQGLFGALLMGTTTRSVPLRVLGASLFVLSPVLANRLNHAALCAHWLILAALWLNRRQASSGERRPNLWAWSLLIAISAATHPYLTAMVLALAGATIVASFSGWRQWLAGTTRSMALLGAVSTGVWWACGYFVVKDASALQGGGFGRFSLNLLSPVVPPPGALTRGWLDVSIAYGEQHEGFSYVGLGGALLLAVALPLIRLRVPRWRGDMILGLVCLVLTIFALGPAVTLGTKTIVEYPASWWGPLMIFRATGRLFWPVFYTGFFALMALVVRRLPAPAASAVMLVAVLLQASDVRGFYELKRHDFALRIPEPLPSTFWEIVLPKYRHVVLYPSNMCTIEQSLDYRFFALRAGHAGATINGGFAARYDIRAVRQYCDTFLRDMREGNVSDDSLYVLASGEVPVMRAARTPVACVPVDGISACFTVMSHDAWASDFRANALWLPPLSDFVRFREVLEAEYRDRLQRPAVNLPGTADERVDAVVRYLGYRIGGCGASEALEHVLTERAPKPGGSLCQEQSLLPRPLPPAAEVQTLYASLVHLSAALSPTHVDHEGEMIWTHAYAEQRLRGQSDKDATGAVLAAIRDITGHDRP